MPNDPGDDSPATDAVSPIGEGFAWVARITGVGLAMTLPAVVGGWLDARFGTGFLAPAGLVLGFVVALAWIVAMAGQTRRGARPGRPGAGPPAGTTLP